MSLGQLLGDSRVSAGKGGSALGTVRGGDVEDDGAGRVFLAVARDVKLEVVLVDAQLVVSVIVDVGAVVVVDVVVVVVVVDIVVVVVVVVVVVLDRDPSWTLELIGEEMDRVDLMAIDRCWSGSIGVGVVVELKLVDRSILVGECFAFSLNPSPGIDGVVLLVVVVLNLGSGDDR